MMTAQSNDETAMNTMPLDHKDPYTVLGVEPGADMDEVKAAYRARIKEVHPDHNDSQEARQEFQQVVDSYRDLTDAMHRVDAKPVKAASQRPERPILQSCCTCGCITAQPRYVVFHQVKSFLFWAKRDRVEGIFCRDCADRIAAKTSTICWLRGWWSLPGLIWTPMALIRNLCGGGKPRQLNAAVLIRHALAFAQRRQGEMARVVVEQAQFYADSPIHRQQVEQIRQATPPLPRRLKDRWQPWQGSIFLAQLLPLISLPVLAALVAVITLFPWWDKPVSTSANISVQAPNVGDIRHVAVDDLKLRQAPVDGAPVLTLMDRFTAVQVMGADQTEWTRVRTPSGLEGWVPSRSLYAGSGTSFKQEWCAANRGTAAQPGEVLTRRASGDNRVLIHNDGRQDALVKLKTPAGYTVVSYYIPAAYHIGVGGIPEGTYRIETASGDDYSRACGIFTRHVTTGVLPFTLTFHHVSTARAQKQNNPVLPEINIAPPPNDPKSLQYLDADRFAADD